MLGNQNHSYHSWSWDLSLCSVFATLWSSSFIFCPQSGNVKIHVFSVCTAFLSIISHGSCRVLVSIVFPSFLRCCRSNTHQFQTYGGFLSHRGTPKSSYFMGFSIINQPFRGTPVYGNLHIIPSTINLGQLESVTSLTRPAILAHPEELPTIYSDIVVRSAWNKSTFPSSLMKSLWLTVTSHWYIVSTVFFLPNPPRPTIPNGFLWKHDPIHKRNPTYFDTSWMILDHLESIQKSSPSVDHIPCSKTNFTTRWGPQDS